MPTSVPPLPLQPARSSDEGVFPAPPDGAGRYLCRIVGAVRYLLIVTVIASMLAGRMGPRDELPVSLSAYHPSGPLAAIGDQVFTDGSPEALAALDAIGPLPPDVLRVTIAHARESDIELRVTSGELDEIVPGAEGKLAGVYAARRWVAVSRSSGARIRGVMSTRFRWIDPGLQVPPAVRKLQMQDVALHEWGHLLDDALVPESRYQPPERLSGGPGFLRVCRALPREVRSEVSLIWQTDDEATVCGELFAEGVKRLAGVPAEVSVGDSTYDVPGPLHRLPTQARTSAYAALDDYFAQVLGKLADTR